MEGQAKITAVKQAIALEEELSAKEVAIAKDRLALAELSIEANGDDKDALNERAEAIAKVAQAEAQAFDNTLKFRKELEHLNEEAAKSEEERAADARARARAESGPADKKESQITNAFATQLKIREDLAKKSAKELGIISQKNSDDEVARKKREAEAIKMIENEKFAIVSNFAGSLSQLAEEDSAERKVLASAQAIINTYLAATAALASGSEINPIFGIISAATAIAVGLQNVARINGVQFAEGGVVLKGRSHAAGGIPIEAEGDEIILTKGVYRNPQLRSMASAINVAGGGVKFADGGIVTRSISQPIDQNFDVLNIVRNMPAPVVSVKEINSKQKSVEVKENISKR